ncbi:MAG: hypothetical protein ACI3Z8_08750 [Paludibacteraceae bacterium]
MVNELKMIQNNTNIQATFEYEGTRYQFTCPYNKLDRNYDDESYAYFLESIPNTEDGLFEINIVKAEETNLMKEEGYVAVFSAIEESVPDTYIEASIKFV